MSGDWTLAIDTAAGVNIGLARDNTPVDARIEPSSRRHIETLQPLVDELLAAHGLAITDLARIAVGIGPGPFTGLRIGIVTARTLGLVGHVPVRGFSTLDAIALGWFAGDQRPDGEVVVLTDARRKEVYWARYSADGQRIDGPAVSAPRSVPGLPAGGPGAQVYPEVFADRIGAGAPSGLDAALVAARLDDLVDTGLEPAYLRKPRCRGAEDPQVRAGRWPVTTARTP